MILPARAVAHYATRALLDLLLPPTCLTCDQQVDAPGRFCVTCFGLTSFITDPCCHACGLPFEVAGQGGRERICHTCRANPPPWERARAALRYDKQARRLLLPLKYHDRVELAASLGAMMARAGAVLLAEADVVVPVPLHRQRLRARRYNQAALLARQVARGAKRPLIVDALRRIRATPSLAFLSAERRQAAVDGAFWVPDTRVADIEGRRVLLVDDVLTSGATCAGCAEALLDAGAAAVDVLVAARVSNPRAH